MKLVFPSIKYKEKAFDFIQELNEYQSKINGSGGLERYLEDSSYEAWLEKIIHDIDIANVEKDRVPALTYFYVDDQDEIVGIINLRLALNDFLRKEGGHIGYSVRPTQRRKHYATNMLLEGLKVYKRLGIDKVYLGCYKENIGSVKTICNCGGILLEEFYSDFFHGIILKYYIEVE